MSDERKQENYFKFVLYLRNEKIYEKIFTADLYNPVVRYSVDIRERIPAIIASLQNSLQATENLIFENVFGFNTKNYYKHICKINRMHPIKLFVPTQNKDTLQPKSKFQGRGTEFKFGVYINANPIVERNFYVENYNPESRFSYQLHEILDNIVNYLRSYLKKSDLNHMWNDYDLITTYELNIQQVRELSKEKREEFLRKKSEFAFVEKVRMDYNKNSDFTA